MITNRLTRAGSGLAATLVAAMLIVMAPGAASADYVRDAQWHLKFLNVAAAHRISQGEGVVVGLPDTGVDGEHPDLHGVVVGGKNLEGTGNGQRDIDGHGTAMAGDIAGRGHGPGGRDGVLGIAPKASILSVQTIYSGFGGDPRDLGLGISWAVEHGAKVICIAATTGDDDAIVAGIHQAIKADVVVVAGVGNTPHTTKVGYPAVLPGVVAVGGVDQKGNHAAISATGPEMAISAPAVDIAITNFGNRYASATGTSDAAAIVAGAAALVRAKFPNLSATEVVHRLTATATDKGPPGRDPQYGYGIVNLVAALTANVPPATTAAPATNPPATPSEPTRNLAVPIAVGIGTAAILFVGLASLVLRRRTTPGTHRS